MKNENSKHENRKFIQIIYIYIYIYINRKYIAIKKKLLSLFSPMGIFGGV